VGAYQREAVEMILNGLYRDVPAVHGVALLAVGAKLPPVNVGVAVRAFGTHVREHQLGVALNALNFFMHPAQRIAGFVVVKFRDAADGFPTGGGMAIFARDVQRAVRVGQNRRFRRTRRTLGQGLQSQH